MVERAAPHVVVVAYGDPEHLRRCVDGLAAPLGAVMVVDNGLSSVAEELCRARSVTYRQPPRNLGFSGGVNLGLRHRTGRDVLLLNPDAVLPWADVLQLQQVMHDQGHCAAVAPRLARLDGSAEPSSWPVPSPRGVWADALGVGRLVHSPRFLTGAVLLLNGQAVGEIGGFDERFFLYAEESDWQLRALRAGWTVQVVDHVTAVHLGGATSSSAMVRSEHFHRSARAFARKWYGADGAALMALGSLAAALRRSVTGGRIGRAEARATVRTYLRRVA